MLLRGRDETHAARSVLPYGDDLPTDALPDGRGLERRISCASFLRRGGVERRLDERHGHVRAPDTQISDRNRTI